eukprot:173983_1
MAQPPIVELVVRAVTSLKDPEGSYREDIGKWIFTNLPEIVANFPETCQGRFNVRFRGGVNRAIREKQLSEDKQTKKLKLYVAKPKAKSQVEKKKPKTLIAATRQGNLNSVRHFLSISETDVNAIDGRGQTALWVAAKKGNTSAVQMILENRNIDPNKQCRQCHAYVLYSVDYRSTPLFVAVENKRTEVIRLLLGNAKTDVNKCANFGRSPLSCAASQGHVEVVRLLLLENPKIDVNQCDGSGETPFVHAVMRGHVEVVRLLLNNPDVNHDRYSTYIPLPIAAMKGHVEVVRLLMDNPKFDVHKCD